MNDERGKHIGSQSDSAEIIPTLEPDVESDRFGEATKKIGGLLGKAKNAAGKIKGASVLAKAAGETALAMTVKMSAPPIERGMIVVDVADVVDVTYLAVPSPQAIRDVCKRHAEGSFYFGAEIPEKKLANARISFAIPLSERIIALVDCTMFGSAKDGVAFGENGIYWKNAFESPLACEWIELATVAVLPSGSETDINLQLTDQRQLKINFSGSSFKNGQALIQDLRKLAVEFTRGVHPSVAFPGAEADIERGEFESALAKLRGIADSDSCWVRRVVSAGERLCERWPDPVATAWLQDIQAKVADRGALWFAQSHRDHKMIGPLSHGELCRLWREGDIHPNDELKHFGDESWQSVLQTEALRDVSRIAFPELGVDAFDQFYRCREALRARGAFDAPTLFFASTLTRSTNADKPVIHLAFTDREVFLVESASGFSTNSQRCEWESADWQLTPPKPGSDHYQLNVTIDSQSTELLLAAGAGLNVMRSRLRDIFQQRAADCMKQKRFYTAEKLLRQLGEEPMSSESQAVLNEIGVVTQVIAMYDGGHPEFTEKLLGALRLDSQGLEFTPLMAGSPMYLRLPFESIIDIQPPQRGQLPEEIAKQLSGKRRQGMWLKTGLQVAVCGVPGGALLVGGLMAATSSNGTSSGPSMNRICIFAVIQGTPFRMYFDAVAGTAAQLNQEAQQFWNKSAQVRNRFKQSTSGGGGVPSADFAEQKRLLHEIRNLLVRVLGVQHLATLQQLLDAGTLTTDEFQQQKTSIMSATWTPPSSTRSTPATASATPPVLVVVGCPKCDTKLRSKPGIAQCPKCSTKLRVAKPAAVS